MAVTVLVVDDHPAFRAVAGRLLARAGFVVAGEAVDGAAALAAVERLRPDAVLLDVHLPDVDGFAVARALAGRSAPPAVVLVSTQPAETFGERLADAPVRGFVEKRRLGSGDLAALLG